MSLSNFLVDGARPADGFESVWQSLEDWSTARAAHIDLQLMRMPLMNLLLRGSDGIVQSVLTMLLPNLRVPLGYWRPGERLVLPTAAEAGTLILRDIDALMLEDQRRLLKWLEVTAGRPQVVSTVSAPLLPLVEAGGFLGTLYYRLNTVYMDLTT